MKAIALVSGGLDSTLAARLIKEQAIELVALNFTSPFCMCNKKGKTGSCRHEALEVSKELGLELKMVSVTDEFLEIVKNPKHGYGSNMNPCIDCRVLMLKKAKEIMEKIGASFIVTGEVVGQRPMSQQKNTLRLIEKESGLERLILRPLSAKILPPTLPEENGWVNREKLLDFNGRSRRPQIALATHFGIKDYPCAAGGCLLTDPIFSRRLRDLMRHGDFNLNEIKLLKIGRHIRLSKQAKLIVGRDKNENDVLASLPSDGNIYFEPHNIKGPVAIGRGIFDDKLIKLSGEIIVRYCDRSPGTEVNIDVRMPDRQVSRITNHFSIDENELKSMMI